MKKIINKKKYDTETAKELGYDTNGLGLRDFNHYSETLYQKRSGEYFLYGEGGPLSKYARPEGLTGWTSGERIMPMTFEEAREWAEKHLNADEYEVIFGEVVEDDSKTIVSFNLTVSSVEKLKRAAVKRGISMSGLLEQLISKLDS